MTPHTPPTQVGHPNLTFATAYPFLRAWCHVTQRQDIDELVTRALADAAPAEAVFFHHGDGKWWTLDMVVYPHLRALIRNVAETQFAALDI